ncbi:MAG: glycoside hydrolase family 6 protein [Micropruina sp.]|uniref:glycoside hydrolase family 6 protein n=1 Tax=Micropruina sp. TaxID=2737536 RepID=UPI0039E678DB
MRTTRVVGLLAGALMLTACGQPAPPPVNPLFQQRLWVDPQSPVAQAADALRASGRPADADALRPISSQPTATWLTQEDPVPLATRVVDAAAAAGEVPVLVLYHRPHRDCGSYSAGGSADAAGYAQWIASVADTIGSQRVVVILEPDAVPQLLSADCAGAEDTYALLAAAIERLSANEQTLIYLDAGHPGWISDTDQLAQALRRGGIEKADGFSLNVSNFGSDAANQEYGDRLSAALGGVQYVVDSSRNGNGAPTDGQPDSWCNPPGAALGADPEIGPERAFGIARLWVKVPGESDGDCRPGEPPAGQFWFDYALRLIQQRR